MRRHYSSRHHWWNLNKMKPVFCAKALSSLDPTTVNIDQCGKVVSMSFSRGWRHYSFSTEANRDRFVELYGRYKAKPCRDPALN